MDVLAGFRQQFYRCLDARSDALFELTEALFCTDGPVRTSEDFGLAVLVHRRLETGRTSWTTLLDAVWLPPGADLTAITCAQIRQLVDRLIEAGQVHETSLRAGPRPSA